MSINFEDVEVLYFHHGLSEAKAHFDGRIKKARKFKSSRRKFETSLHDGNSDSARIGAHAPCPAGALINVVRIVVFLLFINVRFRMPLSVVSWSYFSGYFSAFCCG